MMTLNQLLPHLENAELRGPGDLTFNAVTTDSRHCIDGTLFFALRGERHDGHDFVDALMGQGMTAAVVERWLDSDATMLKVPDTKKALGQLAAAWRARFDIPLIAVAGSNGKTTVTQMIAAILQAAYGTDQWLATRGNFNNDIGLPLMLCELASRHRIAAFEMGMNHPGEMAYLAAMAQANIAVVTNAQREHQEFMLTVEATAVENGDVLAALPPGGIAVFPSDDACASIWRRIAGHRSTITFGLNPDADVYGDYRLTDQGSAMTVDTPMGRLDVKLNLAGIHNVKNALAATAVAISAGIDRQAIVSGLASFAPLTGRGARFQLANGALIIDESYNANPDSVLAAIDTLALHAGERTLVLGDMGETGHNGRLFHEEVGRYAAEHGIDRLLTMGALSKAAADAFNANRRSTACHFETSEALIAAVRDAAQHPTAVLLFKGSRFMRMEHLIGALLPASSDVENV
jgi:UDP-N-acetylmuramoyl-tripeptide--D-alanyl-D-alanine ligase